MDVTITCPCPESPHDSDTVTLADRLDFRSAVAIRKAIQLLNTDEPDTTSAEILALLTEHYLLFGITGWTLVDAKGKRVEASRTAIRDLMDNHQEQAMAIADAADELYSEQVLLPLLARASNSSGSSPTSSTDEPGKSSTSAPKDSTARRPKPSSPSSTTSSRTDATGTITSLPAGVSNTSRSSAPAA